MAIFSDPTPQRRFFSAVGISLILFFSLLVLFRLGRFSFWQDEAETALLAKSILENGLPYSWFDGKWVTQFHGLESRADHLWYFTPWLPFYLTALSFKIFGFQEWAGRLPFALCGIFAALVFWRTALQIAKRNTVALIALFLFVTNATTLLYMRQCKYYPPYLLGFLLALNGILAWEQHQKGIARTVIGFLIAFHCNYLSTALALAGFGFFALFFRAGKPFRKLFGITLLSAVLFFGPFLMLAPMSERSGIVSHWPTLAEYLKKMGTHLYYWNNQVFPILLSFLFFWKRPPCFRFFTVIVLTSCLLLPFFSQDSLRYNFHLLPIFLFWLGFLLVCVWDKNRLAGILLFGIVFGTNFFQNMPDAIAQKSFSLLFKKGEWTALKNYYLGKYDDPIKEIADVLKKRGERGHLFLNHDTLPWEWYSSLPLAYQGDPSITRPKTPPLDAALIDSRSIDYWIGPHWVRLGRGPYLAEEEITSLWQKEGFDYEIRDTGIPAANWDLNSPIRYKHFLNRFSGHPEPKDTIHLILK